MLKFVIAYLWAFALAKVFGLESPLSSYRVEVIQWEVPVSRDGRRTILNGTIQQVYQQLLEINPHYEAEFGPAEGKYTPGLSQVFGSYELAERRDTWSDCGRFDAAKAVPIWEGINHLNHVSGTPVSRPGPGTCGRVSCSYNSAIWWCNDVSCSMSRRFLSFGHLKLGHTDPQLSFYLSRFFFLIWLLTLFSTERH
ncbi:hypothetical protein FJTKL_06915 [Diaporthe vaccinii]|uniref:Uncharacterized protein n=1 Tax=Diaporthe vaccinii TaxID=105482 RepID=A0ABR4EVU5_9PEZI